MAGLRWLQQQQHDHVEIHGGRLAARMQHGQNAEQHERQHAQDIKGSAFAQGPDQPGADHCNQCAAQLANKQEAHESGRIVEGGKQRDHDRCAQQQVRPGAPVGEPPDSPQQQDQPGGTQHGLASPHPVTVQHHGREGGYWAFRLRHLPGIGYQCRRQCLQQIQKHLRCIRAALFQGFDAVQQLVGRAVTGHAGTQLIQCLGHTGRQGVAFSVAAQPEQQADLCIQQMAHRTQVAARADGAGTVAFQPVFLNGNLLQQYLHRAVRDLLLLQQSQQLIGQLAQPASGIRQPASGCEHQPDQQCGRHANHHRQQAVSPQGKDGLLSTGTEQYHHGSGITRQQGAVGDKPPHQVAGRRAGADPKRQAGYQNRDAAVCQGHQQHTEEGAHQGAVGTEQAFFDQHAPFRLGCRPDGHG